MLKKYSFLFIAIGILIACNETNSEEEASTDSQEAVLSTELPSGFHDFYDKFHTDSTFQMDRVVFPLKGEMTRIDSMETLTLEKVYTEESWKIHRPFNASAGYNRGFTVMGDLVIEKMQDNMGLLTIERRWGKVDSTWSLIYYGVQERSW